MYRKDYYSDTDNIYYNLSVYNPVDNNELIEAVYSETRNETFGINPEEYALSVIRFNIPNTNIPIFSFQDNSYSVTLSFGGNDLQEFVVYIPSSNEDIGVNQPIFKFQQFIDQINTALTNCYNNFVATYGAFPTATRAPYMTYSNTGKNFSIHVEKAYETDGIQLFMNWELFRFFETFEIIFNGYNQLLGKDIEIMIKDNFNNTDPDDATLYKFTQEIKSFYLWYDISKINILSSTLNTESEYIGNKQGKNATLDILTDFTPSVTEESFDTNYIFFPVGPYRLIDFNSNQDLRTFEFRVRWEDKYGNSYPLYLSPSDELNIKLVFIKKF